MTDDLLAKCVIDTSKRKVYLYSDEGKENVVSCDTVEEFMNVLHFVRDKVEEAVSYTHLTLPTIYSV